VSRPTIFSPEARPVIERAGPGAVDTLQSDVRRYPDAERAIAALRPFA